MESHVARESKLRGIWRKRQGIFQSLDAVLANITVVKRDNLTERQFPSKLFSCFSAATRFRRFAFSRF